MLSDALIDGESLGDETPAVIARDFDVKFENSYVSSQAIPHRGWVEVGSLLANLNETPAELTYVS